MSILDKIKYGIDLPLWRQCSPMTAHAAGGSICSDKRNDISAYNAIFHLSNATALNVYYAPPNGMSSIINPGISAFGAGSDVEFVPSLSYIGSIGAGCTTTKIITTTNNGTWATNGMVLGEGIGFKIRIIGNAAGSSGKIEERYIIANTSGTTPSIYLNEALSFTPADGDTYEIMAGRVYCLGTTAGATQFRYYRIGIGDMVSAANTTLTIATDSDMRSLDEQYVPYDRNPGEGFLVGSGTYDTSNTTVTKYCLTATASASGSLTGEASAGDYNVIANEYRNFQIRIVEDTAIPTAVNQRRIIASHTAGVNPVYTLGTAWSVIPSATAKYVIELPNVLLLFTVAAGTTTYTYNPTAYTINNGTNSISTNTWSTSYFGARGTVVAAGTFTIPSWGHRPTTQTDGTRLTRHSYIYSFRGNSVTLDMLDIAGGTAGAWTNGVTYNSGIASFTTGSGADYAPVDNLGRYGYIVRGATNQMLRFDVKNLTMYPWAALPAQAGTAAAGNRVAITSYMATSGIDKISIIFVQGHLSTALYRSEAII
jgi:hypothetical protein